MRIDVHAHYNPPEYFAELDRIDAIHELTILQSLGHPWLPSKANDPKAPKARAQGIGPEALDRRIASMDAAGVDKQSLDIGAVQPYVSKAGGCSGARKDRRRRAVAYFHPVAMITAIPGVLDYHLAPDFVSPAEMAVTASRLVCSGIVEKFPNVRINATESLRLS